MFPIQNKVVLVLVDGMRPDGLLSCGHAFLRDLTKKSTYCLRSRTVMPSVTLPCHTSLFMSVDPERHGILTNDWHAQVRPIESLTELVHRFEGRTAMMYNWEQLRDLAKPSSLDFSYFRRLTKDQETSLACDRELTDVCIENLRREQPDFTFLYLGATDESGHRSGWMSEPYLEAIANASACIQRVYEALDENTSLIVTADHGGQERSHGYDTPECMTIPILMCGPAFKENNELEALSIKDIAPTIARVLGIPASADWEGKSVI